MKKVVTYGTFDLLHPGHIHLFKKGKALGDYLIVGLSTDKFAAQKGKKVILSYKERKTMIEAVKYVDKVIPERSHTQKLKDVKKYNIDLFVMGSDYKESSQHKEVRDKMSKLCKIGFIKRKGDLSTTKIKKLIELHLKSCDLQHN